jgi:MFS family permease
VIARLSAVVHGLVHAWMLILPGIAGAVARRYHVSELEVAAAGTIHYLAFGLGAIPAGLLADRFGPRAILLACLALGGAAAMACALASTFAAFAAALLLLGAAASLYHPAGMSMISRSTPPATLGRALGIHGMGGNLGESLAPGAAALLASQLDLRAPFAIAAILALLVLVPVWRLPRVPAPFYEEKVAPARVRGAILSGPVLLILVSALLSGLIYRGSTYFIPPHLGARLGGGETLGAVILSVSLQAGVVAQWMGGHLADRFHRVRMFLVLQALALPMLVAVALLHGVPVAAAAIGFGFVWYLGQPLLNSAVAGLVARERHGRLYGLQFTASFGLGALAVSACARIAERWGTAGVFVALAGVTALNVLLAATLLSTMRSEEIG